MKSASKIAGVIAFFHIVCVLIYMLVVENAHIPILHQVKSVQDFLPSDKAMLTKDIEEYYDNTTKDKNFIRIKLGLLNCCTLHLTVIGSILLVFLGGYGLAQLPMEFLNSFLNRPQIVNYSNIKLA